MKTSRRSFIKKSSFTAVALSFLGAGIALADDESSKKRKTTEEVSEAEVIRVTRQPQRRADEDGGTGEIWVDQGDAVVSVNPGDLPPPPIPTPPPVGYPVKVGWKEDPNEVRASLKEDLPGSNAQISYDPDEDGEASSTNNGIGAPPEGYDWSTQVRDHVITETVHYSMTYIFADS